MAQIKLTESKLNEIIAEAVQQAINEGYFGDRIGSAYQGFQAYRHNNKAGKIKQQIDAQIAKSEEIIRNEQAKINALRQKYNAQIDASKAATDKANAYYASAHGIQNAQQYGYVAGEKDDTQQDFYNAQERQQAYNSGMRSAYGRIGQKARQTKAAQPQQQPLQ